MGKSPGVLITLIVFIILTLALGVTTYFVAQGYKETSIKLAEANQKLQTAEANVRQQGQDLDALKGKIGYPAETKTEDLLQEIETFLKEVGGEDSDVPQTCRDAIERLYQQIQNRNAEIKTALEEQNRYMLLAEEEEAKTRNQKEEFDKTVEDLTTKFETQTKAATDRYDVLAREKEELVEKLEDVQKETAKITEDYKTQTADANETVDLIANINNSLRTKIEELTDPLFEIPDGKIIYVDQTNKTVRLNIGKVDGVRLLTTFGVFPADALEKGEIVSKGSLEIIRIISDHESEARILADEMENPFMPGDMIYTPLWKSGEGVNIALDYFLDVDNDNQDDLDLLVNLINASGSKVAAWIDGEGEIRGKITPDVTYLIVSNDSVFDAVKKNDQLDEATKTKIEKAHMEMMSYAKANGVREIKLSEFLRRTHYKQGAEVTRFQEPARKDGVQLNAAPVVSNADIAPIYNSNTKDARPISFGVTAPKYESKRNVEAINSSGKVSDSYFRKRTPKEL